MSSKTYEDYESLPCLEDDCRPYYDIYKTCTGSSGGDDSRVELSNDLTNCLCVPSTLYKLDQCKTCLSKSRSEYEIFDKKFCTTPFVGLSSGSFRFPNLDEIKSSRTKKTIGISVGVSGVVLLLAIYFFIRYRNRKRMKANKVKDSLHDNKEASSFGLESYKIQEVHPEAETDNHLKTDDGKIEITS